MSSVTVSRETARPVSQVWSALSDFGGVHRFSAGVESSPINPGTPSSGVGSERNCQLYDGNHIQERVTESIEEQKLGIEIFETSMPLESAAGTFTLSPTPSGGTRVSMEMNYVVKFGFVGRLMDSLMMKKMMTASLDGMLAGLDHHLTTGETVGKGWKAA
jgi:hypothetical protein